MNIFNRYASDDILKIFSDDFKYTTWRKLWVALAEGERALGLSISQAQISELKKNAEKINYEVVKKREKETRHDVMSHLYAYGAQCPKAKSIIHLGATSAYVTDNADLIQMRDAMEIIEGRLISLIKTLREFALRHRNEPTLSYTHFQPAQPTTVGKRAALWLSDLVMDIKMLRHAKSEIKFLGAKGATGTQASFLALFDGNAEKAKKLDRLVAKKIGFSEVFSATGQTYPRKVDSVVASALCALAQSAGKFSSDIRLLQGLGEMSEPFEEKQVGSSAMPYKKNPMRSERLSSLSRFLIILSQSAAHTASNQWLERTLDDSAIRRLTIPQMFFSADAILILYQNIAEGLKIQKDVIRENLQREMPFFAMENILMKAVKKGGDRQILHERLRKYALQARTKLARPGVKDFCLMESIAKDKAFRLTLAEIKKAIAPSLCIGRAPQQVSEFIKSEVDPILKKYGKRKIPKKVKPQV